MRVTLLTYNICEGGRGRESVLTDIIAAQNADVILLQEVEVGDLIGSFAAQHKYEFFVAASNSQRTIALLSRLPIRKASSFHPARLRHTCLSAELEYTAGKNADDFWCSSGSARVYAPGGMVSVAGA